MLTRAKSLLALMLMYEPLSMSAVIEVTAGGTVTEPTYQFSDASGNSVATFTADVASARSPLLVSSRHLMCRRQVARL